MARQLEEIKLTFEYERIRFDNGDGPGTAIIECRGARGDQDDGFSLDDRTVVKVQCEPAELIRGLDYRFYGRWEDHPKHGRQFVSQTFVRTQPHGRRGVIAYLQQAPWVGKSIARKLHDIFGGDAVRITREQPEVAATAAGMGFTTDRALEAAEYLEHEQALEAVTIDLADLLTGRRFPKNLPREAVKEWGNRAAQFIRHNPYLLMRFRGVGFLKADRLYLDEGGDPNRLKRQALCAWYTLDSNTDGHTWFTTKFVEQGLRRLVGGAKAVPLKAVRLAVRSKALAVHSDESKGIWLAEGTKARAESAAADRVRAWLKEPAEWPAADTLEISHHQRYKLSNALASPIGLFGGGPGTGKTYTAAKLIDAIARRHGSGCVAVAAPTGKAAVRITEAMQSHGLSIRARTIHSLLGVASVSERDGWGFEHGKRNPLPYKYVVVDESSMTDCNLAASLFRACGLGTHLLLVGDVGQLPPVGHGAPLRDLIAAGVPYGELTEIRRNSGLIVQSCHLIRCGKMFQPCGKLDLSQGQNLTLLPAVTGEAALEKIVRTIKSIGRRGLANPIWECQVVVALNTKGSLNRREVNQRLQRELNPGGEQCPPNPFRVGDKIVCLKNGQYAVVEDSPTGFNAGVVAKKTIVANGEQAEVKYVEPLRTIAQLDAPPRLIVIPRGQSTSDEDSDEEATETGCSWDLAYGISCHKSQGSEWPVVFVCLDESFGARMVCSREWLYTGISRAKKVCFLVGKLGVAEGMIQRQAISRRKTFLKELITHVDNP